MPTPTGALADHRLPVQAVADRELRARASPRLGVARAPASCRDWIAALVANDLQAQSRRQPRHRRRRPAARRPRAGARDEPARSATSARRSSTPRPAEARRSNQLESLRELVADMNAGTVKTAGHPRRQSRSSTRRPICNFARALDKVPFRAHLGLYDDETSTLVPLAHPRGALPRDVERRARVRRHRLDRPAADRAALQRPRRRTK